MWVKTPQVLMRDRLQNSYTVRPALARLQRDPRITVRLGNDVRGYGQESSSRVARQQIPHAVYKDAAGADRCALAKAAAARALGIDVVFCGTRGPGAAASSRWDG